MLKEVSVSIPYLVLSTEVNISGEVTRNVLTPFGYFTIGVTQKSPADGETPPVEIHVEGDTDTWLADQSMPIEFRKALASFTAALLQNGNGGLPPLQGHVQGPPPFHGREVKLVMEE